METSVVLSNGIKVINFSSAHDFVFEDGSILPACSEERAKRLMLDPVEVFFENGFWKDVNLSFKMSKVVDEETVIMAHKYNILRNQIVIVPLPVLMALREVDGENHKDRCFRGIRVVDRVKKICSVNIFCL